MVFMSFPCLSSTYHVPQIDLKRHWIGLQLKMLVLVLICTSAELCIMKHVQFLRLLQILAEVIFQLTADFVQSQKRAFLG